MAQRATDINPGIKVHPMTVHYGADNRDIFFSYVYDYIIDAIDLVSNKLDLIESAIERNIPIVSSLGTGNKFDPLKFHITDIAKTVNCPLARVIRKELRKKGILHHRVLYSHEDIIRPEKNEMEEPPPGRRSIPGSVSWVPACAGLMLAGDVILRLSGQSIDGGLKPPSGRNRIRGTPAAGKNTRMSPGYRAVSRSTQSRM